MEQKITITIGRQFGSGGSEIGQKLAKSLGFAYYDKELITITAKENGLCQEIFERNDERATSSFAYALSTKFGTYNVNAMSDYLSNERLFELQSRTIQQLAAEQSCVIIGRCADYILRESPCLVSFFISDNIQNRIRRISEQLNISEQDAQNKIKKMDKSRASFYNFFSDKKWGSAQSYNLCIDISVLGMDRSVEVMKRFVHDFVDKTLSTNSDSK